MHGVADNLDNETEKRLLGSLEPRSPVNEQILSDRLNGKQRNVKIIQVYAPTS